MMIPSRDGPDSTALLTDHYELTMLEAALASGLADRRAVFEVFSRRLPAGRRYGVLAGVARMVEAVEAFRFGEEELEALGRPGVVGQGALERLAAYRFGGGGGGGAGPVGGGGPGGPRAAGVVPVRGLHRHLRRGRALLPRLPGGD